MVAPVLRASQKVSGAESLDADGSYCNVLMAASITHKLSYLHLP